MVRIEPIVEKRFEYRGLPCVVLFMAGCYRCGYVGLPKSNRYYKKGYDDIPVECHGGLTFASGDLFGQSDKDTWWIGFDCAHCFDGFDVETAKKLYADNKDALKQIEIMGSTGYFSICNEEHPFRTLEYCEEECKSIVEQILNSEVK